MKTFIGASIVLYVIGVGVLVVFRTLQVTPELTTSEMLYGPAITIAFVWIVSVTVNAMFQRKKP